METITKVFVGVDVSKETLDIHIHPIGHVLKVGNNQKDIIKFIKEMNEFNIELMGCESTGGYESLLKRLLKKHDYSLWIIDPRRIKGFIASKSCKSKTDKIDAKRIAEFVSVNYPDYEVISKSEEEEELHVIINRKNDLIKFRASEKIRLKHPSHFFCITNINKCIKFLDKEIKDLEYKIRKMLKSVDVLSEKIKIIESIPGIGNSTAQLLASSIPELGKINNREISALLGLCPYENESGKFKGKKFIKGGRATPRKALYMCALAAIKFNAPLKIFYNRLLNNKKPFKVAIVAVMHKLIIIANSLLKRSEFYKIEAPLA